MKNALLRGRLTDFGELLGEAWQQKKTMSPRIATAVHRRGLRRRDREHGALGGKVTGAGGGGYMLFYCPFDRKHRRRGADQAWAARSPSSRFELDGLRTWRVDG